MACSNGNKLTDRVEQLLSQNIFIGDGPHVEIVFTGPQSSLVVKDGNVNPRQRYYFLHSTCTITKCTVDKSIG